MSGEKDELVQKAKLAEQAERWVEMFNEKMLFLVDAHFSCRSMEDAFWLIFSWKMERQHRKVLSLSPCVQLDEMSHTFSAF